MKNTVKITVFFIILILTITRMHGSSSNTNQKKPQMGKPFEVFLAEKERCHSYAQTMKNFHRLAKSINMQLDLYKASHKY